MASNLKEQPELLSKAEEKALIQRIRNGDREEFQVLVRQYQGRIFSLAQRLLCNPEEAEDCAQEAFLKAYQNLSRFSGLSSFYTWLYRITTNLALSRLRYLDRRGRGKTRSLEVQPEDEDRRALDPVDPEANPRDKLVEKDLESKIEWAMGRLPVPYRVVVVLRDIEDKSYEEVSKLTGLTLGTVKSRLHEGRARLQKMLVGYL